MKLSVWLKRTGTTTVVMAKGLRVSDGTISKWANEKQCPSIDYAFRIQEFTRGAVKVSDWRMLSRRVRRPARLAPIAAPSPA